MNNYVLISKRTEFSDHVIDSSSDNLEILSKRMESLDMKGYYENKIFHLENLSSGKEYINDKIELISKSMAKYKFYPIYRIKTSIDGIDKMSLTSYFMANELILDEDDLKKVIDIINGTVIDTFNKIKFDRILKNFKIDSGSFHHKYKLMGMDSWIVDPVGNYFTNSIHLTKDKLKDSFNDYIERHPIALNVSNDEYDESISLMDYSKFLGKRVEDMPVCDKYINNPDKIKIDKCNKLIRLYIDE